MSDTLDRYGRVVLVDDIGIRYVIDDGMAFYITDCCDATAKGTANAESGVCCRSCYEELDPVMGGLPIAAGLPTWEEVLGRGLALDNDAPSAVLVVGGSVCDEEDCDRAAKTRGKCRRHYQIWYRANVPGAREAANRAAREYRARRRGAGSAPSPQPRVRQGRLTTPRWDASEFNTRPSSTSSDGMTWRPDLDGNPTRSHP